MGDEDYTELYETDIIPNTREYYDVYPDIQIHMEEFEFHPEPRRLNVTWTREFFEIIEEEIFKDDIERKRKKHRGNSRKYRAIRI
jgi:hypothetical protein